MHSLLAADFKDVRYIYICSAALIGSLLLAFAAYSYFKRWMNRTEDSPNLGFTLSDLRRLHESGKMSDAEYELTRNNMLASARKMTEKLPEVFPGRSIKPSTSQDTPSATGL